jgi:uncharacterized protein YegL
MKNHVKIDAKFYLATQVVSSDKTVQVAKKINHIFIVDVSGSMSGELSQIRRQLKNNLSNVMNEGDTITIIWFSGRNDCGILKEEVEVKSLKTLEDLNNAIDRWLKPIGLTAFCKPLTLTKEVIDRIKKNRPDSVFSMVFLTDGYNNDCSYESVLTTLKSLESDLASACFVEYGYYADSQRLTQMASVVGGEKISASSFEEFEPFFNKRISSPLMGGKKVVVEITDPYLYDFAYSVTPDGGVVLYNIEDRKIMVGGDVKEVYFFSPDAIGTENKPETALYAAVYVLADKLKNDDAEKIFYVLGDQHYYLELLKAFGKQKLNAFKANIKECVGDLAKRYPDGQAAISKVPDDAYCLMNLIYDLGSIDGCLFFPSHPDFVYNRIGRKRVQKGDNLSDDDQKRLAEAKDVKEAQAILAELAEKNVELKFTSSGDKGSPLTSLVWNEERANLSVLVRTEGTVEVPTNQWNVKVVPTFKYNNYTLIKDGIVNVEKLPLSYTDELKKIVMEKGLNAKIIDGFIVLDLSSLPIVNKAMVKALSADALAKQEWELLKLQGDKKVYDYYRKQLFPKESTTFIEDYGADAAAWLKEIGITDYNGFSPKTEAVESTDFYMSVRLATKIKGLSSIPKVEDVAVKLAAGTALKTGEWLLKSALEEYNSQLVSPLFVSLTPDQQLATLKAYIISKSNDLNYKKRKIMQELAQIKFSLILSKRWFYEFSSFDENKLSLQLDGFPLEFVFDLYEKEEKI